MKANMKGSALHTLWDKGCHYTHSQDLTKCHFLLNFLTLLPTYITFMSCCHTTTLCLDSRQAKHIYDTELTCLSNPIVVHVCKKKVPQHLFLISWETVVCTNIKGEKAKIFITKLETNIATFQAAFQKGSNFGWKNLKVYSGANIFPRELSASWSVFFFLQASQNSYNVSCLVLQHQKFLLLLQAFQHFEKIRLSIRSKQQQRDIIKGIWGRKSSLWLVELERDTTTLH